MVQASAMATPFQREVKEPPLSDEGGIHVTMEEGTKKGQGSSLKTLFLLFPFFFKPQMSQADFNLHAGRQSIGITKNVYEFFDGLTLET